MKSLLRQSSQGLDLPVLGQVLNTDYKSFFTHMLSWKMHYIHLTYLIKASLVAQMVKNPPAKQETWVPSLGLEDPLEGACRPTPVFLPGEFHGERSLAGYSSWSHKESEMTLSN